MPGLAAITEGVEATVTAWLATLAAATGLAAATAGFAATAAAPEAMPAAAAGTAAMTEAEEATCTVTETIALAVAACAAGRLFATLLANEAAAAAAVGFDAEIAWARFAAACAIGPARA